MRRAIIKRFLVKRVDHTAADVLVGWINQQDGEVERGALVVEAFDVAAHHDSLDKALLLHGIGNIRKREREAGLGCERLVVEVFAGLKTVDRGSVAGGLLRFGVGQFLIDGL